jgi:NADH-quinone oxidoreductase subunit M
MRSVLCLLCLLVALFVTRTSAARGEESRRAGTVRLETSSGARGPLELRVDPGKGSYNGEISIVNDGKDALVVSRIAVRGDASDPRVPPKLTARLTEGSLPLTIAPGGSKKAYVVWAPERTIRARQLFGHVVVTTSDESSGEVAMGVRAQLPGLLGPVEPHLLSLLIGIPLLAGMLTLVLRVLGRRGGRALAVVALGTQTLLAGYVYQAFGPDISRVDGNDGLQFVEHAVWLRGIAAEIFLGTDGIAAPTLFLTSAAMFLAVLPEREGPRGIPGYHAALLLLDAALVGALTAMDGLLFVMFAGIAVVTSAVTVATWGAAGRRSAATRIAVAGLFAVLLLAVALVVAARQADPSFLVDGTRVTTTFSLPELSRVVFSAKGATVLGVDLVKVCFIMILVATLFLSAAFPAHGWLGDVLVEAPPAAGILIAIALPTIGMTALLRIGCAVLPEGMRWASGVVVALGAVTAAYGALSALGERDLRRIAASAATSQAGFILLGVGSLSPQGLSGAIVLAATRAIACAGFLLLAASAHERARTSDVVRLSGVASQMPVWGVALAASGLAQAGVLGLGGAWGPILALIGVLSTYAPLAIVAAIALVLMAAAHLSAVSRVAFGPFDSTWEKSDLLVPSGGKFPDLTPREWTSVAPLLFLVVLLGLWPTPVVAATTGTVRDLSSAVASP